MLHHGSEPENVFRSIKEVLKRDGKAAIVDLYSHEFEEFKTEMGDVHMSFKPEYVYRLAHRIPKLLSRLWRAYVANALGA